MTIYWQSILKSHYGLDVTLTRLDGEYDLNFAADAPGQRFIFKVMRTGCAADLVDMQCAALAHLAKSAPELPVPHVIPCRDGAPFCTVQDENGADRLIWLQSRCDGTPFAAFSPKSFDLLGQLGQHLGTLDQVFANFDHSRLAFPFKWQLPNGLWIEDCLDVITNSSRRKVIENVITNFKTTAPTLNKLPNVAIHNDLNDYNILVQASLSDAPKISGLIDFGDMTGSPRVCDLAIAAAYAMMDQRNPQRALVTLVKAYHEACPLLVGELDILWPLVQMRLAVSVVNSTVEAAADPDDPYITISQAPAWELLENTSLNAGLIRAHLRAVCGFPVTDGAEDVLAFLSNERGNFAALMGKSLADTPIGPLSVAAVSQPQNPFDLPVAEAETLGAQYGGADMWIGLWHEPRLIYTAPAFRQGPWKASDRRTVHLAVDVFAKAGTPLLAPLDGVVEVIENRTDHLDYGGVIILRHQTPNGTPFFTLYGHLSPSSFSNLKVGDIIPKGGAFCALGPPEENGGWAPHVHFQLALTTDGMGHDWPGVGAPDEMDLWGKICPNPAALLNLPDNRVAYEAMPQADTLAKRNTHFGSNLKLSYQRPVSFLRGWRHHLFDEWGRPFLDAYNNVPHVGHAHPRIAAIAADQLTRINTNTRYLHGAQTDFADEILKHMPTELSVCYFVNSGSEANELALRLARAASGGRNMITPNHGYHGNTTGAIDVSAYKFNAKGGIGQPDWVELVNVADTYNGAHQSNDPKAAEKYAAEVETSLQNITRKGGKLAGWICETFPSVGGQIIPPQGYLASVYEKIRAAGGICIADEVQTGLGRLGTHYFAFEQQGVTPDIVVLGKPIGNGHPIGVVVTTPAIAAAFAKGPEFFSTFGGSTLSCRIGTEVLRIVEDENLGKNAAERGTELLDGLKNLQSKHAIIGDVRGVGLFVGVELVTNPNTREPATKAADYILNRLRDQRILVGTEGPNDNILKIRPPLTIEADDIEMILKTLGEILSETALAKY